MRRCIVCLHLHNPLLYIYNHIVLIGYRCALFTHKMNPQEVKKKSLAFKTKTKKQKTVPQIRSKLTKSPAQCENNCDIEVMLRVSSLFFPMRRDKNTKPSRRIWMQQRTQSELSLKIYICVSSSASTRACCRRCADDGRQLWNGCLDEDVLAPGPLGREMRMLRGEGWCCVVPLTVWGWLTQRRWWGAAMRSVRGVVSDGKPLRL